jgi:DNA topoisomerase-1
LVKNFGNILDYNFTAKVEQDFDEIAEGNVNWTEMMQFYDKFHPIVKDVEANAERESGERILGKIQNRKAGFVRLGKFGPMAQIEKQMMKRKICQFNARSKYWKYWFGRSIEFILLPKI